MITIYFDGLCEPVNPNGIAAYGYVIYQNGKIIKKGCRVIGEGKGMTNNVAEYSGLKRALEWLSEQDIDDEITIKGDSTLAINQMTGVWQIRSETSRRFVPQIRTLLKGKKVSFVWIPREKNSEADMLSRVAYKRYRRQNCELPPFSKGGSSLGG
ncbi:MAG: ribonuclease HI [Methanocellales archaeon]|nr:ribonuclease HI [Methanocellales archaeon]